MIGSFPNSSFISSSQFSILSNEFLSVISKTNKNPSAFLTALNAAERNLFWPDISKMTNLISLPYSRFTFFRIFQFRLFVNNYLETQNQGMN